MIMILCILASLIISFLAVITILVNEVIDIRSGYRPDFVFVIFMSIFSLIPFGNFLVLIGSFGYLVNRIMNEKGYSQKIEDYIIKLVRGKSE